MEKNLELGPAKDAVELYGPDIVTYELCKADFEKWYKLVNNKIFKTINLVEMVFWGS